MIYFKGKNLSQKMLRLCYKNLRLDSQLPLLRLSSCISPSVCTSNKRGFSSHEGARWLWELNDIETELFVANKYGTRTFGGMYTFNSKQPLEPEHIQRAFEMVMQMTPNMRTTVRRRGNSLWFCQLPNNEMDFKVYSDAATFLEDSIGSMHKGFHDTDTLPWKARMIREDPPESTLNDEDCKNLPHQCRISIHFDHPMIDALSSQFVSRGLLQSLNYIFGGAPPTVAPLIAYEENREFEKLLEKRKKKLLEDPGRLRYVRSSLPEIRDVPTVFQAFPRPEVSHPTTGQIFRNVDSSVMKALSGKCSQKGITMHSFLMSVCNLAFAELMQEAGFHRDKYKLTPIVYVDHRRFSSAEKFLLGYRVTTLSYACEVANNARKNFWGYCKKTDQELHDHYRNEGLVLDQAVVQRMMLAEDGPFDFKYNPRPAFSEYGQSYGHQAMIQVPGGSVQVTNAITYSFIHNSRVPLFIQVYIFRNKTMYTFSYADNYYTKETVNLIADRILHLSEILAK